MKYKNLDIIENFTEKNLPDLDVVVLAALEKFQKEKQSKVNFPKFKKPIIAASVNALTTAKILYGSRAIYCDENDYKEVIKVNKKFCDGAIIFSASGGKHAPILAKEMLKNKFNTYLVTCSQNSDAQKVVGNNKTIITQKNREPYTYNTSTYLGWVLEKTGESPKKIQEYIEKYVDNQIDKRIAKKKGYYILIPDFSSLVGNLFDVKFEELFGTKVGWQTHTFETSKHAKTVIPPEYTIVFGEGELPVHINEKNKCTIPIPNNCDVGTMMAIGYYVIGKIQKGKRPYFKKYIQNYIDENKKRGEFAKSLNVIVE